MHTRTSQRLLERVRCASFGSVSESAPVLGASEMIVRRDIPNLTARGLVREIRDRANALAEVGVGLQLHLRAASRAAAEQAPAAPPLPRRVTVPYRSRTAGSAGRTYWRSLHRAPARRQRPAEQDRRR